MRLFRSGEPPNDDAALDDPRVCYCMKVHRDRIVAAIRDGAVTVAELGARTRAGTGCGTCRIDLLELIAEHAPGRGAEPDEAR